jgi:hypothetical protein
LSSAIEIYEKVMGVNVVRSSQICAGRAATEREMSRNWTMTQSCYVGATLRTSNSAIIIAITVLTLLRRASLTSQPFLWKM